MRGKPAASSSRRLNSETPSPSSVTFRSRASSQRPRRQRSATRAFTPTKYSGGVMLWYTTARRSRRLAKKLVTSEPMEKWKSTTESGEETSR